MKTPFHITKTLAATVCLLALSPALGVAGNAAKTKAVEQRGLIKSVDANAHTLIVNEHKGKTEQAFSWNDQTKFTERSKAINADALKTGEHVRLTFTPGGVAPVLQTVQVIPAKPRKPGAGHHSTASHASARF